MVEEWDRWRRGYEPAESALIVHGPNSDVDLVNELAQQKRLDAGELAEHAVPAVDRDYLLRPGDVVAMRNAAYTFQAQPGQPRPKRIENGQTAIVESVDPQRDTLTLLLREPGAQPRLVEIDQARLRAEHACGKRAAAVRLNYALHTFPAQGATVHGTATLAGHWSQAKQETYVGDTRAIYRHSVHIAREDLGTDGTDEDRRVRTRRTVRRQPSRPARQSGSSSSSGHDRRSGSLASGGSARPGASRHYRAAARTRRPAPSSPQSPPPRRVRARPGPPRGDSRRRRSLAARRSGGEPSRGLLPGLGYVSRGKECARHAAPSESEIGSSTAGVGWVRQAFPCESNSKRCCAATSTRSLAGWRLA